MPVPKTVVVTMLLDGIGRMKSATNRRGGHNRALEVKIQNATLITCSTCQVHFHCAASACSFIPSALTTLRTVSKSGLRSPERAL